MIKENIQEEIKKATDQLFRIVRFSCSNKITDNCRYIITEIKSNKGINSSRQRAIRKNENRSKEPMLLIEVSEKLNKIFDYLFDVIVTIYHAKTDVTIVE